MRCCSVKSYQHHDPVVELKCVLPNLMTQKFLLVGLTIGSWDDTISFIVSQGGHIELSNWSNGDIERLIVSSLLEWQLSARKVGLIRSLKIGKSAECFCFFLALNRIEMPSDFQMAQMNETKTHLFRPFASMKIFPLTILCRLPCTAT